MSETVIKVENISKFYQLGLINHGTLAKDLQAWWAKIRGKDDPNSRISMVSNKNANADTDFIYALKDVSFDVKQGEVLGIIGANGAGKSTLLKILSRVTSPTSGCIKIKGRIGSLLEVGTGFHPELTGRENIYLNGAILGMRKHEIDRKLDEIIDFSGVEKFIDTPVKRYSSGMYVRLAFAVAAHLDPEILVVDEVLAVGDAEFQKKCLGKMDDVSKKEGRTVLFVSHNMTAVKNLCQQGIILKNGTVDYYGDINSAIDKYISNQAECSSLSIANIKDRLGNGFLRFYDIQITDFQDKQKESFEVGEPVKIKVFFHVLEQLKQASSSRIDVGINNIMDYQILWMSTYMYVDNIDSSKGYVQFNIPQLPLSEGIYNINLYSEVNHELADWTQNVSKLKVCFHDYYKNGRVMPVGQVPIVLNYSIS